jgi:hypothetical protein
MSEDQTVSFSLEVNVEPAYENIRKLETVLYRSLRLAARLTGNENLQEAMEVMQEAIATANKLRLAYAALQAARMAAGDPLAWALAGVAIGELAVDVMMEVQGS